MANWQRKIKLNPEWDQCQEGEITRQQLAQSIAQKLFALQPIGDELAEDRRVELAETFEDMSRDEDLSDSEFNGMMDDLYDWGDTSLDNSWNGKKVCWVDCFSPALALPQQGET